MNAVHLQPVATLLQLQPQSRVLMDASMSDYSYLSPNVGIAVVDMHKRRSRVVNLSLKIRVVSVGSFGCEAPTVPPSTPAGDGTWAGPDARVFL